MKYIVRPYRPGEEKHVADAHKRIYSESTVGVKLLLTRQ
jgi:hypothetical protein